jgi:SAM-dependent methyltransferase
MTVSGQPDYFSNHRMKLRFPWRLYHGPIVESLRRVIALSPGPDILNLGSGPFFELKLLEPSDRRFTVCDVDARAIEVAKELWGSRLAGAHVIEPDAPLPYPDAAFDLIVSMDVIEHVPDPVPWVKEALRVLRPGGVLYLTTPNYGSTSLRVLENTALEAVARYQGFSRKHIHPTKMTTERLRQVLEDAGGEQIRIEPIAFGWVLAAYARRQ